MLEVTYIQNNTKQIFGNHVVILYINCREFLLKID